MYYCKNCGELYSTEEAVLCVRCGVPKYSGEDYCHNCGNRLLMEDTVCYACGVPARFQQNKSYIQGTEKSKLAAGLLAIFLGQLGVHNFYLGYNGKATAQLVLTIIGYITSCILIGYLFVLISGVWGFIEGILILSGVISSDANGMKLIE